LKPQVLEIYIVTVHLLSRYLERIHSLI